jgi:hypothetical protein
LDGTTISAAPSRSTSAITGNSRIVPLEWPSYLRRTAPDGPAKTHRVCPSPSRSVGKENQPVSGGGSGPSARRLPEALAAAEAYLDAGHRLRAAAVRRIAADLALTVGGCSRARPHLLAGALEITGSPGVSGIRFQPSASGGTHRASS